MFFFFFFFKHRQIEIDSKFLEAQHIMDYSLLLGVHYRAPQHLRSLMFYRNMTADGLARLAEEGGYCI
jgi:1-phosphatidylinositol-4-phosphate 5-kinase